MDASIPDTINATHRYQASTRGYYYTNSTTDDSASTKNVYFDGSSLGLDSSVFNETAARATIHSVFFETYGSPYAYCEFGCPVDEFCGEDGECHIVGDCEVFYKYGPKTMTGRYNDESDVLSGATIDGPYKDQDMDNLVCTTEYPQMDHPYQVCGDSKPLAVQYECNPFRTYTFGNAPCPEPFLESRYIFFHRMCTAYPNEHQDFVCYDMQGFTDLQQLQSYTQDYVDIVTEHPNCTVDNLRDTTEADAAGFENPTTCTVSDYEASERVGFRPQCLEPSHTYTNSVSNTSYRTFLLSRNNKVWSFLGSSSSSDDEFVVDEAMLKVSIYSHLGGEIPDNVDGGDGGSDGAGKDGPSSAGNSLNLFVATLLARFTWLVAGVW
jgi:hypothetical protein